MCFIDPSNEELSQEKTKIGGSAVEESFLCVCVVTPVCLINKYSLSAYYPAFLFGSISTPEFSQII